nr:MAG TPA: hypothetical protein [Caudoviricetes sp.]
MVEVKIVGCDLTHPITPLPPEYAKGYDTPLLLYSY